MDGSKVSALSGSDTGGTDVRLFGVDKTYLYCVTGKSCLKINFSDFSVNKITDDCYSIYQAPILTSDGILFYSSIADSDYVYVSKAGGPYSKIFSASQLEEALSGQKIRAVNFAEDYIFLTAGQNVYYTKLGSSELKQLKGITTSETGRVFFDNEYCIAEGDSTLVSLNINWLLSA
jgi:hypothetical protein